MPDLRGVLSPAPLAASKVRAVGWAGPVDALRSNWRSSVGMPHGKDLE